MQYPALITSDLHLTASPATEYRWHLFDWLRAHIKQYRIRSLLILGDLTDAKDNHPAELVNRIVKEIGSLPVDDVIILAGNHDWLKQGQEFFRFLNQLPNVRFITEPTSMTDDDEQPLSMFLPYSKNPPKDWAGLDFSMFDYLFMHQTVKGAIASNGEAMEGEALPPLNAAKVYSGDIHVPQIIGPVEYVGSPYHVHFGDDFKARCILLRRDQKPLDLHFQTIKRVVVKVKSLRDLKRMSFTPGDQVKLRVELAEEEKHGWSKLRRQALEILTDAGVVVHGVELTVVRGQERVSMRGRPTQAEFSPPALVYRYSVAQELGADALDAGLEVLES